MTMRALVTGATSGLGREAAVQLARRGWRVALTGRRADKLKEAADAVRAAGGEPLELLGGVDEQKVVRDHYARLKAAWGGLDYAVLNAGIGDRMRTNVFGVAYWLEAVLPDMVAAGSGTVAAVSSLAGFRGLPSAGPYSASKAALNALMESARVDLRGTGVRTVTVCPGFVKTELTDRNEAGSMPFLLETEDGVARMLAGIDAGRRVVHFPWQLSLTVIYLLHNLPGFLYDRFAARLKRPKRPQ
ncbi:MAG: short chain dehydrogenase/reductase family oxidoreductase [Elusimicrobia bacterium]|nr:MAG: short chain dehydrogenase/reductase family oxidoreductase [Elusimicrobiota bacterium]